MLSQIESKKADKTEFSQIEDRFGDFDNKLKHISVFLTQISMAIHPEKDKIQLTQNSSIIKKENILN